MEQPNSQSKHGKIITLITFLALTLFLLQLSFVEVDGFDVFWHLHSGKLTLEEKAIQIYDKASFTYEGQRITGAYWLYDVLLYVSCGLGGNDDLLALRLQVFRFASIFIAFFLLFFLYRKTGLPYYTTIPPLILACLVMTKRWAIRPEITVYGFGILAVYMLLRLMDKPKVKPFLGVLLILLLWNNFHFGTSFYGYVLLGGFFIHLFVNAVMTKDFKPLIKVWIPLGLLSLFLSFLSPSLSTPLLAPLQFDSRWYGMIAEYKQGSEWFYRIFILYALFLAFWAGRQKKWGAIFIVLVFSYGVWFSSRSFSFLALMMIVIHYYLANCDYLQKKVNWKHWCSLAGVLLVMTSFLFSFNLPKRRLGFKISRHRHPVKVVKYMKHKGISGNVYNHAEAGGYLSYFLYPDIKVFIDGRMGILYPYDFSRNEYVLASKYQVFFQPVFSSHSIDYIMAPSDLGWFPLLRTALLSGRFEVVCSDGVYTLLAKTEEPNIFSQVMYREIDLLSQDSVNQMKLELENSDGDLDGIQHLILELYELWLKHGSRALNTPDLAQYYSLPILTRCAIRLADIDGNHQLGLALLKRLKRLGENDYLYLIRFHLLGGNIQQANNCIRTVERYFKTKDLFIKTEALAEELQFYQKCIDFLKSHEKNAIERLKSLCKSRTYYSLFLDHLKREQEKRVQQETSLYDMNTNSSQAPK